MNDKLKCRVWDKNQNKMFIPQDNINYCKVGGYVVSIEIYQNMSGSIKPVIRPSAIYDNAISMQCTGLKDKNGKLIYEGDIIVIPNQYPFYDYKNEKESQNLNDTNGEIKGETILNYVGVVEYIFNGWQYVLNCVNPLKRGISNGINYHINEQGFEEDENSCYEVIGNIYETPELLQEK